MAFIKFYPVSMRATHSAYRRRKRLIISYPGDDYDFETTIMIRARRMGYYFYRHKYFLKRCGQKSLVFER